MLIYQYTAFTVHDTYDIFYGGHKSNAGVASGRRGRSLRFLRISLLHNVPKRVHNRTARFRCDFGSTDGYGV